MTRRIHWPWRASFQPPGGRAPAAPRPWPCPWPWLLIGALLLILCLRLTVAEPVNAGQVGGFSGPLAASLRYPGAAELIGFSLLTLALVGVALSLGMRVARGAMPRLFLIAALVALALLSAFRAANRFAALLGVCDLGMALLAGWLAGGLCRTQRKRGFVVAVLAGLLAVMCVKGFYQRFVELPLTRAMFQRHASAWLAELGIRPGSVQARLFYARLNAHEVSGFLVLSDVFAEALLPLLLVALALGLSAVRRGTQAWRLGDTNQTEEPLRCQPETRNHKPETRNRKPETGNQFFPGIFLLLLFAAGVAVVVFTRSKGALATLVLGVAVFIFAWRRGRFLARHRWKAVAVALLTAGLAGSSILAYGLSRHTLPTRDLRFRWQYWTGAARIIAHHPWLGVGLNNFGYYYPRYKAPQAPEDVKDPHNPLVRLAAEAGWPAAALWAILLLAAFLRAVAQDTPIPGPPENGKPETANQKPETRNRKLETTTQPPHRCPESGDTRPEEPGDRPVRARWLAVFVAAWWGARFLVTGPTLHAGAAMIWPIFMAGVYALAAFAAMAGAQHLWAKLSPDGRRTVALAAVLGAAGMCLYDQINMALVTGAVAMLFWVLLGAFQARSAEAAVSHGPHAAIGGAVGAWGLQLVPTAIGTLRSVVSFQPRVQRKPSDGGARNTQRWALKTGQLRRAIGAAAVTAAAILGFSFWWPAYRGTLADDSARYGRAYAAAMRQQHWPGALRAVNSALTVDRRSTTWLTRRIGLEMQLGLNPRADVLRLLRWNPTSARLRWSWAASRRCGLSLSERIHQLKRAVQLNGDLPPHDITRLSPAHLAAIELEIHRLETNLERRQENQKNQ